MAVRQIIRMGDPLLKQVSEPVEQFDTTRLHALVTDMKDTMVANQGAGLAAIQIGVPLRVMLFGFGHNPRYPDSPPVPETVLINPEIRILDDKIEEYWEGCLSVPGMRGLVPRPAGIHYSGFDVYGNRIERSVDGFHARVVQHEYDHLDGILYPARIRDMSSFGFIEELETSGVLETNTGNRNTD